MLPSGLNEIVGDVEELARFLTSSGQFNSTMVKSSAFLPSKADRETSVFRHGATPPDALWLFAKTAAGDRKIYGAGIITAAKVRDTLLEVSASEPPPRHAALVDWPWNEADPDMEKARHKEIALALARDAELVRSA